MISQEEAAAAPAVTSFDATKDDVDNNNEAVNLVMTQANVSRDRAIKALKKNEGDIVNTIMELVADETTAEPSPAADNNDDDDVDAGDLDEKEINLVMNQTNASRGKVIEALKKNKGDIVNTIMELVG
jgi:NACalpha-BTF3-like transcription factor